MSETNANPSNGLNDLKSMFSDYQKKQTQSKTRKTKEEILAKYFVPRNTKETFRVLKPKQGRKHVEEAFFHVLTTNVAGEPKEGHQYKQKFGSIIYCPAHNDPKVQKLDANGQPMVDQGGKPVMIPAPCAACEKYKAELKKQDQSIRGKKKENMTSSELKIKEKNDAIYKEAIKWAAKKFYIIKGIDKGQEKDGVKFWRFKHNFKNQGTLDKLLPILEDYMTNMNADFSDPVEGTDLSITMTDSEFNGRVYKTISAITYKGKSLLHQDPLVSKQWTEDEMTWRDVFKPKQAPLITPERFLELLVEGNSPFWDDTDPNNKKWVFPNHPDLEHAANNRSRDLEDSQEEFEQASDREQVQARGSVSNMTEKLVGKFNDDSSDIGQEVKQSAPTTTPVETTVERTEAPTVDVDGEETDEFDDLPF